MTQARKEGIIIYSIGIGPAIDEPELRSIAGELDQVYHVETYDDIDQLKQNIGVDLSKCYNPLGEMSFEHLVRLCRVWSHRLL